MADPKPIVKKFKVADAPISGLVANFISNFGSTGEVISPRASLTSNNISFGLIPGTNIYATKFAGVTTSYLSAKNTDKLQLTKTTGTSFTVEAWIYAQGAGQHATYGGEIVNKDNEFEFCRLPDGRIAVAVDWGLGTDVNLPGKGWIIPPTNTAVVPLNTATHVAIVVDNTTLKIVLNGSLAWEKTELSRAARTDATDFYIGNRNGKTQGFNGYIGNVRIWNYARSVSDINANKNTGLYGTKGIYTATMPFDGTCTIYAWGGAGGAGGADAGSEGGAGAPGLYNSTTFSFLKNDVIEVSVGQGGLGGASNSGSAPGGGGGFSRVNIGNNSLNSFNGGDGSASGPTPYSGGGGGGGGATLVLKNGLAQLVAGGGGGGGGAGNDGNSSAPILRRTATLANNATGKSGNDFRGENAQTKGGDGGGAGGGGGGLPGGNGGAVYSGDASGYAGECGGNYPVTEFDSFSKLYPRSDNRYSAFMNSTAVWPTPGNEVGTYTIIRSFDAPYTGKYYFRFAVDNSVTIYIDDVQTFTDGNTWNKTPSPIEKTLTRGVHKLKFVVSNVGDVAGVGITISDSSDSVIWNIRDYADINPPGRDSKYYVDGVAKGGMQNGGNGQDGYAVLVIQPSAQSIAASAVKIGSNWRQVLKGYVKVSGIWHNIDSAYIKKNGTWRKIVSTGDASDVSFAPQTVDYGKITRGYS